MLFERRFLDSLVFRNMRESTDTCVTLRDSVQRVRPGVKVTTRGHREPIPRSRPRVTEGVAVPASLPTVREGRWPYLVTMTYFLQPLMAFGLGCEAGTYSLGFAGVCPPKSVLRGTRLLTKITGDDSGSSDSVSN